MNLDIVYIDVNTIDALYLRWILYLFMKKKDADPLHAWLVMLRAFQSIAGYSMKSIKASGLYDSEFRILEALLHKGPQPVNALGPKVNLTPGSISAAVERLHREGLVTREEHAEDRRVRIVALTKKGTDLIVPVFQRHADEMRQVFGVLSPTELQYLESALKKTGRKAQASLEAQAFPEDR